MHLVLRWLLKPGNYTRWTTSPEKTTLVKEILKEMEKNGIKHRKPRDVYAQIYSLTRRFEPVKKWLEDQGQLELFCRSKWRPRCRGAIRTFESSCLCSATMARMETKIPTKGRVMKTGIKRKSVPSPQDTSELPMSKRGKRMASTTQTRAKTPLRVGGLGCLGAILRHKMKREGISDEEINSAIPM